MVFASCSKKETVSITDLNSLSGKKIGVQSGTTGESFVNSSVSNANIKSFKSGMDAALDLKNGAIDAIVLDELPAKEIVKRNSSLKIIDTPLTIEEYAIAVKKGNLELLESINKTIATLRADGTYEKLINMFMPIEGSIVLPAEVETSGVKVLRMGTNAAFPPFEYMDGSKIVGFDVTMSQYIASDFDAKLAITDMAFDGLIAALQAGSIDFIAAGMTATDERRKSVDFSDPYYSSAQVIIVRK